MEDFYGKPPLLLWTSLIPRGSNKIRKEGRKEGGSTSLWQNSETLASGELIHQNKEQFISQSPTSHLSSIYAWLNLRCHDSCLSGLVASQSTSQAFPEKGHQTPQTGSTSYNYPMRPRGSILNLNPIIWCWNLGGTTILANHKVEDQHSPAMYMGCIFFARRHSPWQTRPAQA